MKKFNGKVIEDASKLTVINVMRKDIWIGDPQEPQSCAIARSIRRGKDIGEVRVGSKIVLIEKKNKVVRYELTPEESRKIKTFDKAGYFEPGQYTLLPPKVKLGDRKGTKSGSNVRKGQAKTVYKALPLRHAMRVNGKGVQPKVAAHYNQ